MRGWRPSTNTSACSLERKRQLTPAKVQQWYTIIIIIFYHCICSMCNSKAIWIRVNKSTLVNDHFKKQKLKKKQTFKLWENVKVAAGASWRN